MKDTTPKQKKSLTWDDLPNSIVATRKRHVDARPDAFEKACSKPSKIVPLPRKRNPMRRRMLQGLAQYSGRTAAGTRRSMLNLGSLDLKEGEKMEPVQVPSNLPQPHIPVGKAPHRLIDLVKDKTLRSVLSREEYNLYLNTWNHWCGGHPEYDQPEDITDIHTLCMEDVLQMRYNMLAQRFPNKDMSSQYNQSFNRSQKARENLAARRRDRLESSKSGNTTYNIGNMNVATLAGQVDQKKLLAIEGESRKQLSCDMDRLDHVWENVIDVVDGEVV